MKFSFIIVLLLPIVLIPNLYGHKPLSSKQKHPENVQVQVLKSSTANVQGHNQEVKKTYQEMKREKSDSVTLWGRWEPWSPCSVTCGTGVESRLRRCISKVCIPEDKEIQIRQCTPKICPT